MAKKNFRSLLEKAKQRDTYWVAKAIQDFTEDLFRLMEARGTNKAELARHIGKSPAYITKVFRGNSNFTIDSMVKLTHALNGQLCIHVGRKESQVHWFDVIPGTAIQEIEVVSLAPVQTIENTGEWFKHLATEVHQIETLGVASDERPLAA